LQELVRSYPVFKPFQRSIKRAGGDILPFGDGVAEPIVVAFVVQNQKGLSDENEELRADYFARCLDKLATFLVQRNEKRTVLFPFLIGCVSNSGDWKDYSALIAEWSRRPELSNLVEIKIVCHNA